MMARPSGIVLSRIMTLFGRGEFNSQTPADHFSAAFQRKNRPNGEVVVFWEPGYDLCLPDMCGFDNQLKWRLDYTLQWIVEQWG